MQSLIDDFQAAGPVLQKALRGLSEADLHATPGPGKWSIQQLVIHLQDSDAVGLDRMRRVIAEENPALMAFDETRYVARLHCDAQSVEDALTLFEVGRRQMARVLRRLTPTDFGRQGHHNEAGPLTLQQLLENYTQHFHHHLQFLRQKRDRLGKPGT